MAPFNTAAFPDSLALGKADALLIGTIDEIQASRGHALLWRLAVGWGVRAGRASRRAARRRQ